MTPAYHCKARGALPFRAAVLFCVSALLLPALTIGCTPQPPSIRAKTQTPAPTVGSAENGKTLYESECLKCHKLTLGQNKKGPHLLGVYGAPAAELTDYKYSVALKASGWTWDAITLDTYITNSKKALPDGRMRADGVSSKTDRQDIIAYLATLPTQPAQQPTQ